MVVNVTGIIVLVVFYLLVLIVGIVAARRFKTDTGTETTLERNVVAGRSLSTVVGIFTMTATTVGGGFLNGTAESVATQGIWWTLAPFGIVIGLILGGVMFAEWMRNRRYLTMLDPFQERYANCVIGLFYLAAICGDTFWSASVLAALGTSLSVLLDVSVTPSICISAVVGVVYTLFGQMVAVAYTDIIQLLFIIVGLVISVPFAVNDSRVESLAVTSSLWLGQPEGKHIGVWLDLLLAMTLGTIPWQSYFQRVLSMRSGKDAQLLSIFGGVGAFILAIPPTLIGIVAVNADWNQTTLGRSPLETGNSSLILPLVLKHFTPNIVAIIGLSAISAAVMSSMDSAILGSSSMFTNNIYKAFLHKKASECELLWIQRMSVLIVGSVATVMALFVPSIYGLFILAADFIYVVMFPQLVVIVFWRKSNSYGAILGYMIAVLLRLGAGESYINMEPFIHFPFYSHKHGQLFPFRTFAMLVSIVTILLVSLLTDIIFKNIPSKFDIFHISNHHGDNDDNNQPPDLETNVDEDAVVSNCSDGDTQIAVRSREHLLLVENNSPD